jgi:hypothetical protein
LGHLAFLEQQASSSTLQVKARSVMADLAWASFRFGIEAVSFKPAA